MPVKLAAPFDVEPACPVGNVVEGVNNEGPPDPPVPDPDEPFCEFVGVLVGVLFVFVGVVGELGFVDELCGIGCG